MVNGVFGDGALRWLLSRIALVVAIIGVAASAEAQSPAPTLVGPKRVVAVGKFDTIGAFTQKYGQWDIGGGLSAMLATALEQSGRVVVLERAYVQQLISESQLKANGVVNPETGPKLGQMSGAQFLIFGAVTEFGTDNSGGGVQAGYSGAGRLPLNLGLGTQNSTGAVAIDIRIVDTSSGQILQTLTVREPISSSGTNLTAGYGAMTFGGDQFNNTPLGEAARRAVNRAVYEIIASAARQPWQGRVVQVTGREVTINAGSSAGVQPGSRFSIQRVGQTLTDPSTGEVLSVRKKQLGTVQVRTVEDKIASGTFVSNGPEPPRRGDIVVLEP